MRHILLSAISTNETELSDVTDLDTTDRTTAIHRARQHLVRMGYTDDDHIEVLAVTETVDVGAEHFGYEPQTMTEWQKQCDEWRVKAAETKERAQLAALKAKYPDDR